MEGQGYAHLVVTDGDGNLFVTEEYLDTIPTFAPDLPVRDRFFLETVDVVTPGAVKIPYQGQFFVSVNHLNILLSSARTKQLHVRITSNDNQDGYQKIGLRLEDSDGNEVPVAEPAVAVMEDPPVIVRRTEEGHEDEQQEEEETVAAFGDDYMGAERHDTPIQDGQVAPVKAPKACDQCRVRKTRCSGSLPCQACERRDFDCTYTHGKPHTPSRSQFGPEEGKHARQRYLVGLPDRAHSQVEDGQNPASHSILNADQDQDEDEAIDFTANVSLHLHPYLRDRAEDQMLNLSNDLPLEPQPPPQDDDVIDITPLRPQPVLPCKKESCSPRGRALVKQLLDLKLTDKATVMALLDDVLPHALDKLKHTQDELVHLATLSNGKSFSVRIFRDLHARREDLSFPNLSDPALLDDSITAYQRFELQKLLVGVTKSDSGHTVSDGLSTIKYRLWYSYRTLAEFLSDINGLLEDTIDLHGDTNETTAACRLMVDEIHLKMKNSCAIGPRDTEHSMFKGILREIGVTGSYVGPRFVLPLGRLYTSKDHAAQPSPLECFVVIDITTPRMAVWLMKRSGEQGCEISL